MMELLPKAASDHLKSGNEPALTQSLGMSLGEYLEGKEPNRPPACPACKPQIEDSGMMSDHIERRCKPRCNACFIQEPGEIVDTDSELSMYEEKMYERESETDK